MPRAKRPYRRKTRPFPPEEIAMILRERAKKPPTSWEQLGRWLDRHPMSISDKHYRLTAVDKEDREPKPFGAKAAWPSHARFDINGRTLTMKPLYSHPAPKSCVSSQARQLALGSSQDPAEGPFIPSPLPAPESRAAGAGLGDPTPSAAEARCLSVGAGE